MNQQFNKGLLLTSLGSFWWGFIGVLYFKYLDFIGYIEVVVHRCLWTAATLMVTTFIFSKWIIVIFSGQEVIYSTKILSLLSFIPFLAMLNFRNILLILVNEKKEILNKATWISLLFMVSLAITLTYYYKGFGLAVGLLISELINFLVHYYLLNNEK